MRAIKMNQQDKQLTNFLGKTIGSALDNYMANLADKQQKSERKIAAVEDKSRLVQQEKSKLEQQLKERDKKINDLEMQLRQIDNDLAIGRKKLEKAADLMLANKKKREAEESNSRQLEKELKDIELKDIKVKMASLMAKPIPTQIDTPKPPPELDEVAKLLRTLLRLKQDKRI
jgi:septal ring factor EnvC (AmiA/AmiB activator)